MPVGANPTILMRGLTLSYTIVWLFDFYIW
nr:MAG TPA: hypothetical protein [Caudoviricetes sp.]